MIAGGESVALSGSFYFLIMDIIMNDNIITCKNCGWEDMVLDHTHHPEFGDHRIFYFTCKRCGHTTKVHEGIILFPDFKPIPLQVHRSMMKDAWGEAEKSKCLKKKVGAVLYNTSARFVEGTGYGGSVHGCEECLRKEATWTQDGCWSVHAEMRAMFDVSLREGENGYPDNDLTSFRMSMVKFEDHVMYTTHGPCDQCLKYMGYFGVPAVVYEVPYRTDYSKWSGKVDVYRLDKELGLVKEN